MTSRNEPQICRICKQRVPVNAGGKFVKHYPQKKNMKQDGGVRRIECQGSEQYADWINSRGK